MNNRAKGIAITLFGVICISPEALLVRFLSTEGTDPWVIIFWKLLFSIPFTASFAIYEEGGAKKLFRNITANKEYNCAVIIIQALCDIGFTLSFVYTSAAIALLLINLNPLWGAVIGKFLLKDDLPIRTYIALVLALQCVLLIFVPDIVPSQHDQSTNNANSFTGNIVPFVTGIFQALYLSVVRKAGQTNISLVGSTSFGALLATIVSVIITKGQVFPSQFWNLEIWKFWLAEIALGVMVGIISVTMAVAPRFTTAPEIGLCTLLEIVLAPLLIFLAYNETPSKWTIIGGSLLLCVLAVHESRPLFEKSRELYRSVSKRMSSTSRINDVDAEALLGKDEENDDVQVVLT